MKQYKLQIVPMDIDTFAKRYEVTSNIEGEYKEYLKQNSDIHHYGELKSLENWYKFQMEREVQPQPQEDIPFGEIIDEEAFQDYAPMVTINVWSDGTWCYIEDIEEYGWKSDDYQTVVAVQGAEEDAVQYTVDNWGKKRA